MKTPAFLRFFLLVLTLIIMFVTMGIKSATAVVAADCPGACKDGGGSCCEDSSGTIWFGHRGTT